MKRIFSATLFALNAVTIPAAAQTAQELEFAQANARMAAANTFAQSIVAGRCGEEARNTATNEHPNNGTGRQVVIMGYGNTLRARLSTSVNGVFTLQADSLRSCHAETDVHLGRTYAYEGTQYFVPNMWVVDSTGFAIPAPNSIETATAPSTTAVLGVPLSGRPDDSQIMQAMADAALTR